MERTNQRHTHTHSKCEHWTLNNEHRTHNDSIAWITFKTHELYTEKKNKDETIRKATLKRKDSCWQSNDETHTNYNGARAYARQMCVHVYTYIYIHIYRWFIKQASKQANNQCMSCTIVHSGIRCSEPDSESNCVGVYLCNVKIYVCTKRPTKIILFAHRAIWFIPIESHELAASCAVSTLIDFLNFIFIFHLQFFHYFFLPLWLVV